MKELEVDESDDVSALSMDGASVIAGMSFAKRMRKDFAKLELVGEEEDEAENDEHQDDPPRSRISNKNLERTINNGDELIEPFPKTYEEWQRKKERKERKKEKKKHKKKKKSSKSGSRTSRSSRSQKDILPIMEISIQSLPDNDNDVGSSIRPDQRRSSQESKDSSGYPSITSSTADSTRRGSSSFIDSGGIRRHSSNLQHSYRSGLSHGYNSQSESANSRTHMTGHSTHMTGGNSTTSQSHITADTLHQLRTSLDRVKIEEQQVMDIHGRLETEVQNAQVKSENAKLQLQSITSELQASSLEREALHNRLDKLQHDNKKLKAKLQKLEEVESDGALDDVLDSMQAKIRQLKRGNKQRSSRVKEKQIQRSERIDEGR